MIPDTLVKTKQPIIFAIDDDPAVLKAIARDLRSRYRKDYRILSTESPQEALDSLKELKNKNEAVAMFLSDQRMPDMLGVDFLEKAKKTFPDAKRVLLTAYSDIDAAIKAINDVHLDYYLTKPWDPPEEKLFPVLDDLLESWQAEYRPDFEGIKLIGYQFSPKSHLIKDFLSGNLIPYQWMDVESSVKGQEILERNQLDTKQLPVVVFDDGTFIATPELSDIADKIGMRPQGTQDLYDVVIIGAGPSGLGAAVYGASEGLKTALIEKRAPGGQAGTSSRIENYLGFPNGLSGSDLARRAVTQATRFGTELITPQEVVDIVPDQNYKRIKCADGSEVVAKTIVITTGVNYRYHPAKGADELAGMGVYYGAAMTEASACKSKTIVIVGGGNSAGQGAMYLSQFATKVLILVRSKDLSASMSQYLIDQISSTANIELKGETEVVEVLGDGKLEHLVLKNITTKEDETIEASAMFVFIGAKPYTDWLGDKIIKDDKGYVITGRDLLNIDNFKRSWKLEREPMMLETCVPGIFAAGDVRSGAMNRVASAVGEGAMAIKFVHEYLAEN
ncbi:FAD-dependent oxidoreductase [soil metagenome]